MTFISNVPADAITARLLAIALYQSQVLENRWHSMNMIDLLFSPVALDARIDRFVLFRSMRRSRGYRRWHIFDSFRQWLVQ